MGTSSYAIVGLGGRHRMYARAIAEKFSDRAGVVALCDSNPGRLELAMREATANGDAPSAYAAKAFDRMLAETRPEWVIVTTVDRYHDDYICRALEAGCHVITEKPMTTDEMKCGRILETQRNTAGEVRVTFNYRYAPPRSQVKELLLSGVIGDVVSVDFHWLLNTRHGADYFRRWHRNKENSGGLLVHKATHHFDLVNWWLGSVPERVFARGDRRFYLPSTADAMGLDARGERCRECACADGCDFVLRLEDFERMKALYLDCEQHDGYYRDRCVFSDAIDIEDTMSLVVDYRSGATMSYSLVAHAPWEGYIIAFNGTKGRLEHKQEETVYVSGDGSVPGALAAEGTWIRIFPQREAAYEVELRLGEGGHGGADPIMLDYLFAPDAQPEDPLLRAADQRAGAWSILTGIAANRSIEWEREVSIEELVRGVELPDYPAMTEVT